MQLTGMSPTSLALLNLLMMGLHQCLSVSILTFGFCFDRHDIMLALVQELDLTNLFFPEAMRSVWIF